MPDINIDLGDIDLGLYVHFPWCVRKCPYCDFNSHELENPPENLLKKNQPGKDQRVPAAQETRYLSRLIDDYHHESQRDGRFAKTLFLGGGTPSLMQPETIADLLAAVKARQGKLPEEITLEANPGTLDAARFVGYRQAGVNRISIGVQSFSNDALAALSRIHQREEAEASFHLARRADFSNINLDLMYGLPGQTLEAALDDLRAACQLGPEHLSWYQLTIERNTWFHSHPPELPDEQTLDDICREGAKLLREAGYEQYEVSAWAKPGHECKHNLNYWQFGDYLGVGAGAHGKVTVDVEATAKIVRTRKTRMPADYMNKHAADATLVEEVGSEALAQEFLMNVLRLNQGFTSDLFEARTGLPFDCLQAFIEDGETRNLLVQEQLGGLDKGPIRVKTTDQGKRFLDTLLAMY